MSEKLESMSRRDTPLRSKRRRVHVIGFKYRFAMKLIAYIKNSPDIQKALWMQQIRSQSVPFGC